MELINATTVGPRIIELLTVLTSAATVVSRLGAVRTTLVVTLATLVLTVKFVDALAHVTVTPETALEIDPSVIIPSTIVVVRTPLVKAPTPLVALSVLVLLGLITTIIDSFSHQG
jgi:hypothetical protein